MSQGQFLWQHQFHDNFMKGSDTLVPWSRFMSQCPFQALAGCNTAKDPPSPEGFQILALKHLQKKTCHSTSFIPSWQMYPHTSPSSALPKRLGSYLSPRPWNAMPHHPRHTSLDPRVRNVHGLHGPRSETLVLRPQLKTQIHGNMMLPKKVERLIISWSPKWHNACKITYPAYPSYEKKTPTASVRSAVPASELTFTLTETASLLGVTRVPPGNKLWVAELIRSMWAF